MTTTMQAAVVTEFGKDLQVQTRNVPTPGPGQALVKVLTTGVCHTDLHAAEGDWPVKPTPPFVPGHEGVGEVVALGQGVTDLQVGDLVGNAWLWSACGDCQYCRTGWETLCEAQQNGGYKSSGIGRENHAMMLDHYQQTKNLLVSYDENKLGFF